MKQSDTELRFTTAELIDAIEADIAAAHYKRLAAERIAARQQRGLQELRELIDGSDGDYPAAWDYAVATFVFAAAVLVFLFFKSGVL
jgi:hypothetical protein